MNLEDLNKTQTILLTLLVSFVTSIATGIVTASLVEKAPPELTRTINQVVERTIERVVPSATSTSNTVKETTVVIKDEDATAKAVGKAQDSVLPIYTTTADGTTIFIGWGTVLSPQGVLVTDNGVVFSGVTYSVVENGVSFDAKVSATSEKNHIALLKVVFDDKNKGHQFTAASLSDSDSVKLGQSLILFGGFAKRSVVIGIVSSLDSIAPTASSTPGTSPTVTSIESSVLPSGGVVGAPIFNIFGDLLGIGVKAGDTEHISYVPVNLVKALLTSTPPTSTPSSTSKTQ